MTRMPRICAIPNAVFGSEVILILFLKSAISLYNVINSSVVTGFILDHPRPKNQGIRINPD